MAQGHGLSFGGVLGATNVPGRTTREPRCPEVRVAPPSPYFRNPRPSTRNPTPKMSSANLAARARPQPPTSGPLPKFAPFGGVYEGGTFLGTIWESPYHVPTKPIQKARSCHVTASTVRTFQLAHRHVLKSCVPCLVFTSLRWRHCDVSLKGLKLHCLLAMEIFIFRLRHAADTRDMAATEFLGASKHLTHVIAGPASTTRAQCAAR